MKFREALQIRPGVTAVIGSGGKSTLLTVLAEELTPAAVILCTTTHMFPPEGVPTLYTADRTTVAAALEEHRVVCLGRAADDGRLRVPELPMALLAELADYVIVEADGSRTLPLKAHAPHEPVVPPEANQTICVVGLPGFGKPIHIAAHRPERYAALAGVAQDAFVTPQVAAAVLNAEGLADRYYVNPVENEQDKRLAQALAVLLERPAAYGSLHRREITCW